MKILVIQLARLGDIYMTWPALRGLRRTHPEAEIHLMTRPRFEGAVHGLDAIDKHIALPVSQILAPLVQDEAAIDSSLEKINEITGQLTAEKYDWIINFTFSPVSSYLTHLISGPQTKVSGYTRHNDGSLRLPDEVSAYFYAQVGTFKANRVHLADIFASMLDIEYTAADWSAPEVENFPASLPERYIVLHVGASERHKMLDSKEWSAMLNAAAEHSAILPVVLIGAAHEENIANEILQLSPKLEFVNLVGKTKIAEIFAILSEAELLVGCDSAPIHMASLTDTPTFNVSIGQVNFWETGPKSSLGFIYRIEDKKALVTSQVGKALGDILEGNVPEEVLVRCGGLVSFDKAETRAARFQWDLIRAIYLGEDYPVAEKIEIVQAAVQMQDVNSFAIEQILLIPTKGLEFIGPLLDRVDEVIEQIGRILPDFAPLIGWYQAEKIRIPPGDIEDVCVATLNVHERLASHLKAYIPGQSANQAKEIHDGAL